MKKRWLSAITAFLFSLVLLAALTACGETNYKIAFLAENGTELSSVEVREGETPVYTGETPQKSADAQYTYTFAGWKDADGVVHTELPAATSDAQYTATFTGKLNRYTVKFTLGETTLSEETLDYGSEIAYRGAAPEKAEDAQFTYAFSGWSDGTKTYSKEEKLPALSGDVTYSAVFAETRKSYTVTWNVEGQTSETTVLYGEKAVYSGTPEKTGNAQHSYTFAGWAKTAGGEALSADEMTVTGAVTFYAVFTETVNTYTVRFLNEGGEELQSGQVPYGTAPSYTGNTPEKAATAQYSYTFAGWLYVGTLYGAGETLPTVTKELTFTASYTSTVNKYTVTWSVNGASSGAQFEYGQTPAYEGTPQKPDDEAHSYRFAGWAKEENGSILDTLPAVTGDVTYYAVFTQSAKLVTVTWSVDGQTSVTDVFYGGTPVWDKAPPQKEADAQFTYTFTGWATSEGGEVIDLNAQTVTSPITYYAVFSSTTRKYNITFVVEGQETVVETAYGESPVYPGGTPAKEATQTTVYTFEGWLASGSLDATKELPAVTGEATYTAKFSESVRLYTLTIKHVKGLSGDVQMKADTTIELPYGTFLGKENCAITAIEDGGKRYLPDAFSFGGIVTENKTFTVHYTEADIWDGSSTAAPSGQGTSDSPYLIASAANLAYLAEQSNQKDYGAGEYYRLTTSIDLDGHEWTPICYAGGTSMTWKYFKGSFDGAGYTIAGLHYEQASKYGAGLFGGIDGGTFKDLVLEGSIVAAHRTGGLAYVANKVTVQNIKCFVDITVNGTSNEVYSGGLFGTSTATNGNSTFTNLENYGTITTGGKRVGGIIGNTGANTNITFQSCVNYGNVTSGTHSGGIVGQADGKVTLTECVNYGKMTATTQRAGGMVATQTATGTELTDCVNYGEITTPTGGGGIIGSAKASKVTGCTNYASVTGARTGGIIGETTTVTVTKCTNYGNVSSADPKKDEGIAGIVGWTTTSSKVSDCHNHGDISGYNDVGGICGYLGAGSSCTSEGEGACTNDGTVTGVTANHGDLVGYDKNLNP